jgi:hypothetical protein
MAENSPPARDVDNEREGLTQVVVRVDEEDELIIIGPEEQKTKLNKFFQKQ